MRQIAYGLVDCWWLIIIFLLGAMMTLLVGA